MIKKTFYNLPEEKRQRIIDAIMNEFSGSPSEKVSINRIIKEAKISRGSFYQYFDDKVDLVEILTRTFWEILIQGVYKAIAESNGDIFFTYERLFEIFTDFSKDKKQKVILKNLVRNIKANDDLVSDYLLNRFNGFSEFKEITKLFNKEKLKYKSDADVECLSQILTQVLKNAIFNVFVITKPCEEVKENYLHKLEIIKNGALE